MHYGIKGKFDPTNLHIDIWPDVSEYPDTYPTAFQLPDGKEARVFSSWDLSDEYGFTDKDGSQPHWGRHYERTYGAPPKKAGEDFYANWRDPTFERILGDWP